MAYSEKEIQKAKSLIIDQMSNGKSLKYILESNKIPGRDNVYRWLNVNHDKYDKEFSDNYARATTERADFIFDEMMQIADTTEDGVTTKTNDKGIEITSGDMIQHRRLKVDTRKWILGRMNPKKYSDKIQIDTTDFKTQPLFPDVPKNHSSK
jgi:hypothetical protein